MREETIRDEEGNAVSTFKYFIDKLFFSSFQTFKINLYTLLCFFPQDYFLVDLLSLFESYWLLDS